MEVGIDYSVEELRLASLQHGDVYHLALLEWAADEIERLQEIADKALTSSPENAIAMASADEKTPTTQENDH